MFSFFNKEKGPEYISGRIATRKEVKFGFFSLIHDSGEEISIPYTITIPQTVLHINQETNDRRKATLIQAEKVTKTKMKGQVICTILLEDHSKLICKLEELQLSQKNS